MKTILDLGCGTGNTLHAYYAKNNVIGIDIHPENIAICKQRMPKGTWIVGDVTNVDIKNYANVNTIISTEVIEHVDDWKKMITVLGSAPSGTKLYLTTPIKQSEEKLLLLRKNYWKEIGHQHFFTGDELRNALKKHGWTDVHVRRHNAALYFELKALFKRNAPCIRNTYYENVLPLWQKILFLYFKPDVYKTRLKYIPLWLITRPIARLILDPIWGAGMVITAQKQA